MSQSSQEGQLYAVCHVSHGDTVLEGKTLMSGRHGNLGQKEVKGY